MNIKFVEKIFGNWFFIILNLFIIVVVEWMGRYFFNTGMLHIIALFFVVLAVIRMFVHYKTYDQFLDNIKYASIVALFVFAVSHIVEYINFIVYYRYDDAVFATTINFYLIGLASIVIGAELFFVTYERKSNMLVRILYIFAIALLCLNIVISFNHELISLEPASIFPYLYVVCATILLGVGVKKVLRLRNKISISVGFLNYLIGAMFFIVVAMIPNIFYELIETALGIPMFQIMYISHFAFFVSVSLMFLSYKQLSHLPGIYADIEKIT